MFFLNWMQTGQIMIARVVVAFIDAPYDNENRFTPLLVAEF
jgi:hypothetical protein